jgi:hypothetical protein
VYSSTICLRMIFLNNIRLKGSNRLSNLNSASALSYLVGGDIGNADQSILWKFFANSNLYSKRLSRGSELFDEKTRSKKSRDTVL